MLKKISLNFIIFNTMAQCFRFGLAFTSEQVGTITLIQGPVKLFNYPSKTIQGPPPHALFENEYYSVREAAVGDPLEQGNIIRTAPGAKAKIIFENGDQYLVGSGTAYRVLWERKEKDQNVHLKLMHGKLRGIISKGGPRNRLTIRTSTATMGVRGTDFYVSEGAEGKGLEVTILRGEVVLRPAQAHAKDVTVKSGFAAEIPISEKQVPSGNVVVRQANQADLHTVKTTSLILPDPTLTRKPSEEIVKKVKTLEAKAVETTLQDIKTSDPGLYEKIKNAPEPTTADLNQKAVDHLYQTAPPPPLKRKPLESELKGREEGVYEEFYKPSK